jgi:hypothetical protein
MNPKDQRKLLAKKQYITSLMSKKGETKAVIMALKGGLSSTTLTKDEISNDKWVIVNVELSDGQKMGAICNADLLTGHNKIATKLLNCDVYGPVKFCRFDNENNLVDLTVQDFKGILSRFKPS